MKKILLTWMALASILYAQIGLGRGLEGIRVPTAKTLGEGYLFMSATYETVSDGRALSMNGYTTPDGTVMPINNDAPSSGGAAAFGFGLSDILEIGLSLPFYYDGEITGTDLDGFGAGDLQAYFKYSYPFELVPVTLAFSGELFVPTGAKDLGFRPRHQWYVHDDRKSYAFSAKKWAMAGSGIVSVNFSDVIYWNSFIGFLHLINGENNDLLWGTGIELLPHRTVSGILEVSGETGLFEGNFLDALTDHVLRVTPAVKIHLPNMLSLMLGMDVGIDFVRDPTLENSVNVRRAYGEDSYLQYNVRGTPEFTLLLAVTKVIDFSRKDSDNDGVIDREDLCPKTELGAKVNSRGCPVDLDQDGVINIMDLCPETPRGVVVDYNGCPVDTDKDGVPDYLDMCKDTKHGTAVDSTGCMRDSDNDGVDDYHDRCPNSLSSDKVDSEGCPLDDDHDGVLNDLDSCPDTPRGYSVDRLGCPLDFDHDGIPNDVDMCPNSPEGELVNEDGCPADYDRDGVPDSKDECLSTPRGFPVDQNGCPSDHDRDGIPDALDKCPNTPANAPVDSTGCPIDSDGDEVLDYMDRCPGTFPNIIVGKDGCPLKPKNNLNALASMIRFKGNSGDLLNSTYTVLNDVIYLMRRYDFVLEIQCSSPAGEEVAEQQAQAIADYMIEKGIHKKRIQAKGYGKKLPQGPKYRHLNTSGVRLLQFETEPQVEESTTEQEPQEASTAEPSQEKAPQQTVPEEQDD